MVNLAEELEFPISDELSAFCEEQSVCFAEGIEIVHYFDQVDLVEVRNIVSLACGSSICGKRGPRWVS